MKTTPSVFSSEGRFNTKDRRIQEYRKLFDSHQHPESYRLNNIKEELCLEYVKKFLDDFQTIFPNRKRPYMIAKNECGVNKIVCTTIRPTQLKYTELYDAYEAASYFAGFILYEPLPSSAEPPEVLVSPSQTLIWHTGDCFDMSVLLCSVLIGNGYDAYVVHGYAPKFISHRDQSKTQCPLISSSFEVNPSGGSDKDGDDDNNENNPYKPPDNTIRESRYLADQRERKRLESLDTFVLWAGDSEEPETTDEISDDDKLPRVHAWVLIRAGRRDVREHIFLEPSTGRAFQPQNSPYLGVEAIWNDKNVWMNAAVESKVSQLDFDVASAKQWLCLFIPDHRGGTGAGYEDGDREQLDLGGDDRGENGDQISLTMSPAGDRKEPADEPITRILDPPPSWVLPLSLDRPQYLLRYPPHGRRTVLYLRAKVDYYAKNTHPQALVMRVIYYLERSRVTVKEIHEWYDNRKDHLFKRVRYLLEDKVVENYAPGSAGEVRQWTVHAGKRRDIDFYVNARLDRLRRREEEIGFKITEYFEGRTDRLTFRSVLLSANKNDAGARPILILSHARAGGGVPHEFYVLKMTQSFASDPKAPSGTDISKRYFYVPEGRLVSQYHFVQGKITRQTKVYNHARGSNAASMSHNNGEDGGDEDQEGLQDAATSERECYKQIQESFDNVQALIRIRNEFEHGVVIERSVFETALDNVGKGKAGAGSADGAVSQDAKGVDYLTPYLRHVRDPARISKEEALEVRQACLDGLKARLVERANIIQSRLNEENTKLARRQEQFQRSQRGEGELTTEEYEKFCTEAMFRITILEQRLAQHEEAALKKYANLDAKLAADPRLRVLRT